MQPVCRWLRTPDLRDTATHDILFRNLAPSTKKYYVQLYSVKYNQEITEDGVFIYSVLTGNCLRPALQVYIRTGEKQLRPDV
jgi:hypothetical protein